VNEQLPVQLSFDISLPERAQRIRDLVGTARICIIEVGRELIAAKAEVAHGDWLPWLDQEFGWSEDTAQNYMRIARGFPQIPKASVFTGEALTALSAPNVPQSVRDEAVARAEDGEHISKADAEALIAEALATERARFETLVAGYEAAQAIANPNGPPDIPTLVAQLCQATGRKKLKPVQLQQLACILGTAITARRFHTAANASPLLCFTLGRIKFVDVAGDPSTPTQGQCFFYFGTRIDAFRAVFSRFGFVR
jgi:Protein of unknown function (DUF3102)